MKDFRKHIGRLQFICRLGFNRKDFGIGLTATYLPGMEFDLQLDENGPDEFKIDGFWNIEFEFIFIELTMNVNDKLKIRQ